MPPLPEVCKELGPVRLARRREFGLLRLLGLCARLRRRVALEDVCAFGLLPGVGGRVCRGDVCVGLLFQLRDLVFFVSDLGGFLVSCRLREGESLVESTKGGDERKADDDTPY